MDPSYRHRNRGLMYTRCPHCTTIFQITAEQLRSTRGDVPCVTCQQPFNAVESLSDDVTTLMAAPTTSEPENPDFDEPEPEPESSEPDKPGSEDCPADTTESNQPDREDTELELLERDEPTPDDSAAETTRLIDPTPEEREPPDEAGEPAGASLENDDEAKEPPEAEDLAPLDDRQSMEFDAPEQTWTKFFVSSDESTPPQRVAQDSTAEEAPTGASPSVQEGDNEPWISNADIGSIEFETGNTSEWHEFLSDLDGTVPSVTADDGTHHSTDESGEQTDEQLADDHGPIAEPDQAEPDEVDLWNYKPESADPKDELESSAMPLWLSGETLDETVEQPESRRSPWSMLGIGTALAFLLAGQWIHYNRDALATHATYGAAIRQSYDFLGAPLYPSWPLEVFEVTGTEAISGRSNKNALDILANVIVGGQQPVGLPLIRVVLRDRWSNPVASRVFDPSEYLRDREVTSSLIDPGTALPVEISVADPGAKALGYVIDVCLPHRKTGLECQIAKDPFQ